MRPSRMPGYLSPMWSEAELSRMIEVWSELENNGVRLTKAVKSSDGLDKLIADRLSRKGEARSCRSVHTQRCYLYEAVRYVTRFNEMQQVSGGPLWFDMTKEERKNVHPPKRGRRTSILLTKESFNILVKIKSVKKWTRSPKIKASKSKAGTSFEYRHPSRCHSCWSTSEARALAHSWSLVMKKTGTSVRDFVAHSSDDSATLYTPWSHSTASAWRKMKRITTSYLYIQAFNERHAPAKWHQLSDGGQSMWMDWDTLPGDFEDISLEVFDEVHSVDFSSPEELLEMDIDHKVPSPVGDNCPSPAESVESYEGIPTPSTAQTRLLDKSLHSGIYFANPSKTLQTSDQHQECNAFYERMEQLQANQFKRAIQRLQTDIERDIRLSTDITRAIFFEKLGDPGESGDATFVANLLEEQQRQVRNHFTKFQKKHFSDCSANAFVFDTNS